ncbi:MAG: peptidoglycan DD-metalloendopeptidase family protein [Leptolyngbyaceae cyanobacterium MO_188.B28]|nr:peptidoglycan DD-metalloendopeptidase family protein [Leptolyngbyaceae cyanobacterium MO_188.B28]
MIAPDYGLRLPKFFRTGLFLALGLACLTLIIGLSRPAQSFSQASLGDGAVQVAQANSSVEQLQNRQQQIERERANLNQERDRLKNLEKAAENRLKGLEQEIDTTDYHITVTDTQLEEAEKHLKEIQDALAKAESAYDKIQQGTAARLQYLQRQKSSQGWAVLLQSQDLNQFLDRQRQLKRVYAADRVVLKDLKDKADAVFQQREAVRDQKLQISLFKQQLLAQKQKYEEEAEEEVLLIGQLKDDRMMLQAAQARLARDSEKLTILIQRRLLEGAEGIRGTGQMIYPTGGRITSRYGTRVHPILGYRRFHAGVDFGASHGTTIRAADSGTVIFAGWYGGYGRSAIIDHGGGLTTLYAHTSRLNVREGQGVQQGQSIAAVGSTGLSTGPHLHFEVRSNGRPVNPMNYL